MNNIVITHELCADDRVRIDRLIAALEKRTCESCVQSAIKMMQAAPVEQANEEPALVETPRAETTAADAHPVEEVEVFAPVAAKETASSVGEKPVVKMSDIQQKVVALSAAGKKAEVKAVVTAYAERVTLIPENKLIEVFEKLTALEG